MAELPITFDVLYQWVVDWVRARCGDAPTAELRPLLEPLYAVLYPELGSRADIVNALRIVVSYLATPQGRTDANCWTTDLVVGRLFEEYVDFELPDGDVYDVLRDVVMALHDTVSTPRWAANMVATPEQLLEKLDALPK